MILCMSLAVLAASPATSGVDDGTHLTLWLPATTQARAVALVKAYNATHKNPRIDATCSPTDDYRDEKVRAPRRPLEDCRTCSRPTSCSCRLDLGGGLFSDLQDKVRSTLPFAANITQGR